MQPDGAVLNLTGLRRFPILRQAEAAECGLACVGMVASYHGFHTDLVSLRRDYPVSLKGLTLKDLIEIASQVGLGSRAVRCELSDLVALRTPAILHWEMNHFVVLRSVRGNRVTIVDPARGEIRCTLESIDSKFTGVALELTPNAQFQRVRQSQRQRLSSLVKLDIATWQALAQGLVLSLILQLFVLLSPYFMQLVVDEAIVKGDTSLLMAVAIGFALLKIFEVATTILRSLVFQFLSNTISFDIKARLFHHLVRLPLDYFHRRSVGDIQQRFQALQPVSDLVVNGAITSLIDGILALSIGVLLFAYSPGLALLTVGALGLYAILRLSFLQFSRLLVGDRLEAQAKESTRFLETLRAMQTIKVAGGELKRESLWRNLAADTVNAGVRVGNVNIAFSALSQAVVGLSTIAVVLIAAQATIAGTMTVGILYAFLAYKLQLEQRITSLVEQFANWRMIDVQLEHVADIALTEREPGIGAPAQKRKFEGSIDIVDVSFRYAPHESDILKGVTLCVRPGEFVAIGGPSGGGKSTLLRILTGLYLPSSGEVLYDGLSLVAWGPRVVREQLGIVMQDDVLLAGSIAENIAMFDDHLDMDRVREVAGIACIDEEIERFPMAYRSLVGDMGSSLSGGQQQRIMLARALYRGPSLLVIDEGTAHVDNATERRINERLKQLAITRIVVAHRTETLAAADRRVVLVAGQLHEIE